MKAIHPVQTIPLARLVWFMWVLFLVGWDLLGQTPGSEESRQSTTRLRFVFLVDTSHASRREAPTARNTIYDLVASGMNKTIKPGDLWTIRTFSSNLEEPRFGERAWSPDTRWDLANRASDFMRGVDYRGIRNDSAVTQALSQWIESEELLTVFLISDGGLSVRGTPFDSSLNAIYSENGRSLKRSERPFVTTLILYKGNYVGWSVDAGGGQINIPAFQPPPPMQTSVKDIASIVEQPDEVEENNSQKPIKEDALKTTKETPILPSVAAIAEIEKTLPDAVVEPSPLPETVGANAQQGDGETRAMETHPDSRTVNPEMVVQTDWMVHEMATRTNSSSGLPASDVSHPSTSTLKDPGPSHPPSPEKPSVAHKTSSVQPKPTVSPGNEEPVTQSREHEVVRTKPEPSVLAPEPGSVAEKIPVAPLGGSSGNSDSAGLSSRFYLMGATAFFILSLLGLGVIWRNQRNTGGPSLISQSYDQDPN